MVGWGGEPDSQLEVALRGELATARRSARWSQLRVERDLTRTVHDLKAPLAAVKGYVEMMLRGMAGPLPPGASRYLERIREVIDRERWLIEERLNPLRDPRPPVAVCDLGRALEAALARSQRAVQARRLGLEVELPTTPSPLLAQPSLLFLFARRLVADLPPAAPRGRA